jgi:hypothetical protein
MYDGYNPTSLAEKEMPFTLDTNPFAIGVLVRTA